MGFDVRALFAAWRRSAAPLTPYERGLAALERGHAEEALRAFEASEPSAAIANKRGVALMALGCRDAAFDAFCEALERDERYAPALVNLGNVLLEDGAVDDAIDYYRAAMRCDDTYPLAPRNLGLALKRAGRRSESVRALRAAARLEARRGRCGA